MSSSMRPPGVKVRLHRAEWQLLFDRSFSAGGPLFMVGCALGRAGSPPRRGGTGFRFSHSPRKINTASMVNTGAYPLVDETIAFYKSGYWAPPKIDRNSRWVRNPHAEGGGMRNLTFSDCRVGFLVIRLRRTPRNPTYGRKNRATLYDKSAKNIKNNKTNPFPGKSKHAMKIQQKIAVFGRQIGKHFTSILSGGSRLICFRGERGRPPLTRKIVPTASGGAPRPNSQEHPPRRAPDLQLQIARHMRLIASSYGVKPGILPPIRWGGR